MPSYPFYQVDAFTNRPMGGNPCAVLFDADGMDDETMLEIAREMNLSETAFVFKSKQADFGMRFFTPADEIPLAGHPTIATTFALVDSGRLPVKNNFMSITLELKVGPIPVDIYSHNQQVEHIKMTQMKPVFMDTYTAQDVLPVFGLQEDDLLDGYAIQTVSTGTPQLMIPLKSLDALAKAQLDFSAYNQLLDRADFTSPHLFCLNGATQQGDTFARHLSPPPDVYEDPFTGSATGGMAAYLWRYGLIDKQEFNAEQGHWIGRPGLATVEVLGPPEDIQSVKVGGAAVTVLRGEFTL